MTWKFQKFDNIDLNGSTSLSVIDGAPRPVPLRIEQAVNKACADQDGVRPGSSQMLFRAGESNLKCQADGRGDRLSAAEVAILEKWYGGAKNSKGEQLYPGGVPLGVRGIPAVVANWLADWPRSTHSGARQ
jgi:hypothetical protein